MAINLGEINFGLGPDTRRLEAARKLVLQFGQDVNRAARQQAEGARAAEAAMRRQEKALVSGLNATLRLTDAIRRAGGSEASIDSITKAFTKMSREMTRGQQTALQFQRSQADFSTSISRVTRSLKDEEKALRDLERKLKDAERTAVMTFNSQEKAAARAAQVAAKAAADQEKGALRTAAAYFQAEKAVMAFERSLAKVPKAPPALAGVAQGNLSTFQGAYKGASGDPLAQQKAIQNFQRSMAQLAGDLDKYRGKASSAASETHKLEQSIRRLADVSVLISGPMSGIATRLSLISSVADNVSISMAAMVVGAAAGAAAFAAMAKGAIATTKQLEAINQALIAVNGNETIAAIEMKYLMDISDRAGTSFTSLAKQYAHLTAASQGTNLEGEATRKIFENITFAAAKLGVSQSDLEGTLRAVQQIMSKGTIQAEELRGQLGDRLPGAFKTMAEALGVTEQKLGDMMKKGEVSAGALLAFSERLAQKLGVDTSKAIDTTVAAEGRLANALTRLNSELDVTFGFTDAYVVILNKTVEALDWVTNRLYVFQGPMTALANIINGVNTDWQSWLANLANLNPLTAAANTIKSIAWEILGLNEAMNEQKTVQDNLAGAHLGALPEVQQYIKAQSDMKHTIRATTEEYIRQQKVMLEGMGNQIRATKLQAQQLQQRVGTIIMDRIQAHGQGLIPSFPEGADKEAMAQLKVVTQTQDELIKQYAQGSQDLAKLNDILKQQTGIENTRAAALNKSATAQAKNTSAVTNAIDAANDAIKETQAALAIQGLPKYMQEWARVQADINKSVDDFRDKLIQAKVPIETVNALTSKYGDLTRRLKEGAYYLQTHITYWEALSGVLSRGMDTAMTNFVDGMLEGQSVMETFRETAKMVVADLIKTFLQLSAINPLKNALFGGDPSTGMPFQTLGGGLLSSLFSGAKLGGGNFIPNTTFSDFIGANAGGTAGWRGGLTWVGEQGPELLDVRRGARILPQSAFAGAGAGGDAGGMDIRLTVEDDKFQAYITKRSRQEAVNAAAQGFEKGIKHYSNTRFHEDFERHAANRRHRGGRGS